MAQSEKSSQGDDDGGGCEDDAVGELQETGVAQGGDEGASPGPGSHWSGGSPDQREQQERNTHCDQQAQQRADAASAVGGAGGPGLTRP